MLKRVAFISLPFLIALALVLTTVEVAPSEKIYSPDKQYSFYTKKLLYAALLPCFDCGGAGRFYFYDEIEQKIKRSIYVEDVHNIADWEWKEKHLYVKQGISVTKHINFSRPIQFSVPVKKKEKTLKEQVGYDFGFSPTSPSKPRDIFPIYPLFSTSSNNSSEGFISISPQYHKEEGGSYIIADEYLNQTLPNSNYHKIDNSKRALLLQRIGASPSDSLYFYNFAQNKSHAISIQELPMVAELDIYTEGPPPYTEDYFQIGFLVEDLNQFITKKELNSSPTYTVIASKNPFAKKQMAHPIWEGTKPANFPSFSAESLNIRQAFSSKLDSTFTFSFNGFDLWVQQLYSSNGIFHHYIIQQDTTILMDKIFHRAEFESITELDLGNNKSDAQHLWIGKLFKNLPPIFFGATRASAGCTMLYFLETSTPTSVEINCDNRH